MYLRRTKHDEIHALTKEFFSSHLASRCSDPSASVTVTKCSLVQYSNSLRIWPIFSLQIRGRMRQSFLPCSVIRSGAAASYISYNFARGGHCGSNVLYSPIEEQKGACSPIFALESSKIFNKPLKKIHFLSIFCFYGDMEAISS